MELIIEPPSTVALRVERAAGLRYGAADARHPWPQGGGLRPPSTPCSASTPADRRGTPPPRSRRAPRTPVRPADARRDRPDRHAGPDGVRRRLVPADRA